VQGAEPLFNQLRHKAPLESRRMVWNTMLKACANAGEDARAREVFDEMKHVEQPNQKTFGKMIEAAARAEKHDVAQYWHRQMEAHGFIPNLITYSSMIDAAAKDGDVVAAEYWRDQMVSRSVQPNMITYVSLMDAASRKGDAAAAGKWFSLMLSDGITPNIIAYCVVMNLYAVKRDAGAARHVFAAMTNAGIQPNIYAFNIVIHAHAQAGDVLAAERWLDRMPTATVVADIRSYGSLINGYAQIGSTAKALDWFLRMERSRIDGTVVQYSQLMQAYAKSRFRCEAKAERLFERMVTNAVQPNHFTLRAMRRVLGKPRTVSLCSRMKVDYSELISDETFNGSKLKRLISRGEEGEALRAAGRRAMKPLATDRQMMRRMHYEHAVAEP